MRKLKLQIMLLFTFMVTSFTINAQSIKGISLGERYSHSVETITSLGGHRGEITVFKNQNDIIYSAIFTSKLYIKSSEFYDLKKNIENHYDIKLKFSGMRDAYYCQVNNVIYSLRKRDYRDSDSAMSSSPQFIFEFQISDTSLAQTHLLYLRDSAAIDF
ncbi:hypothetical protein [Flammeovirga sp. OC4]|uniref:hypothetical protein n=1 Tax=Flammeovirga sp. OC4 TaxID=1382345 RepID=UPI0012DFF9D1|nr:hypothetical protein [Flammeovirga sp. OC4]